MRMKPMFLRREPPSCFPPLTKIFLDREWNLHLNRLIGSQLVPTDIVPRVWETQNPRGNSIDALNPRNHFPLAPNPYPPIRSNSRRIAAVSGRSAMSLPMFW